MIVVRDVFQAKYGKGGQLVALLKEAAKQWEPGYAYRILTDASGPFFTVVTETEVANLAEWEKRAAEVFSRPDFGKWFARMEPLVESGRREFFNVE
mgnify:CR=1 FL=1